METKKCSKCGRELTVDNFYRKNTSKDGLQDYCKECHKQSVSKSYYKKQRTKETAQNIYK